MGFASSLHPLCIFFDNLFFGQSKSFSIDESLYVSKMPAGAYSFCAGGHSELKIQGKSRDFFKKSRLLSCGI